MKAPYVKLVEFDELKTEAKKLYQTIEESSGKVPKWMKVMANNEDILLGFFAMFKATMDDAPLESKLKWKVANIVSEMNKCEFCIDVANAKLKSMGVSEEALETIATPENEREKLSFVFAKEATEHAYEISSELMAKMKKEFTDEELVELMAVVGLFNYINRFNDALGVFPE